MEHMEHADDDVMRAEEGITFGPVYSLQTGAIGGILGGIAMALVATIAGIVTGLGLWYPLNLVGATVITELQSAPAAELAQFHPAALLAGFVIHFIISIVLGVVIVSVLPTLPGRPLVWSVVVGLALWAIAQFAVVPIINQRMAETLDMPSFIIAHLAYSITIGFFVEHRQPIEEGDVDVDVT